MVKFSSEMLNLEERFKNWKSHVSNLTLQECLIYQNCESWRLVDWATENITWWKQRRDHIIQGDWDTIPITDRTLLSLDFKNLVCDQSLDPVKLREFFFTSTQKTYANYQIFLSSGRKQDLSVFVYDKHMWISYLECILRQLSAAEVEISPSLKIALVGTEDPSHTLYRLAPAFFPASLKIIGLQSGFNTFIDEINQFLPDVLFGYSSVMEMLVEAQVNNLITINPTTIFVGTDTPTQRMRDLTRDIWGAEVFNSYGSTEAGVIAFECTEHAGMHINEDVVKLEIHENTIFITNLVNKVQPFIRYRVPDKIDLLNEPCKCGLPYRRLRLLEGRNIFPIYLPSVDGGFTPVHPIVYRSAIDSIGNVSIKNSILQDGNLQMTLSGEYNLCEVKEKISLALEKAHVDLNKLALSFL